MKRGLRWAWVVSVAVSAVWGGVGCRGSRSPSVPPAASSTASPDTAGASALYSAASLPIPAFGYNAREGRALYRHYCLNCHGDEGRGDGFNAYNLDPKPQSLADSTFQARNSDADLATAIRAGGAAVGLSNGMPPWGRTLNERQIQNLVAYVRALAASKQDQP